MLPLSQVCYNKPVVSKASTPLALEVPQPEKKCENKPVVLPRVDCQEVNRQSCQQVPVKDCQPKTRRCCSLSPAENATRSPSR